MVRKLLGITLQVGVLITRFHPKATILTPGKWIILLIKSGTWLNFFQKIKWFRRVFSRYDKLDASFLAFVYIASFMILLK